MTTLDKEQIDKIDLSYAKELAVKNGLNFDRESGEEAYKLYAFLSTTFDNGTILDVGTRFGNSALSLSYNESNQVISYNIVEEGASDIEKDNITWKIMDFRDDETIDFDKVDMILIDVDPHDGTQEPAMVEYLREKGWSGILLLDDIHKHKCMENWWYSFDEEQRIDVTEVGHVSGTGLVEFE